MTSKGISPSENETKIILVYKKSKFLSALKYGIKKHNDLCSLMDDLNNLWGAAMFTSIISVVANIIWSLCILMEFKMFKASLEVKLPMAGQICGIASNVAWILTMVVSIWL